MTVSTPPLKAVWTSKRKTPDGYYVIALGLYAKEVLELENVERLGSFYIYRSKSWREVEKIVKKAKTLGLEVRE